jgi:hypothetical protein
LFSLKQIFQEDKDLVHGFVALGGLNCLVQIGNEADQNYQNYILRALGQVSSFRQTNVQNDFDRETFDIDKPIIMIPNTQISSLMLLIRTF